MKPSERISEIAQNKSFEKVRDLIPNGAIIAAILVYLDEQAEETNASEEVLLGVDSGPDGTCKLYGYRKDGVAHVTREEYSKPQDEPKEKKLCPMCIEGGSHRLPTDSIMTGTWICFCPCHQKETKAS